MAAAESRLHTSLLGSDSNLQETSLTLQFEAVQLASKSSTKRMEAELASLKRDGAQAAAAHKQAIASWHSRVDQSEAEVDIWSIPRIMHSSSMQSNEAWGTSIFTIVIPRRSIIQRRQLLRVIHSELDGLGSWPCL